MRCVSFFPGEPIEGKEDESRVRAGRQAGPHAFLCLKAHGNSAGRWGWRSGRSFWGWRLRWVNSDQEGAVEKPDGCWDLGWHVARLPVGRGAGFARDWGPLREGWQAARANPSGCFVSNPAGEQVRPPVAPSAAWSDEDLVREALAGRPEAFDALVERYQRQVMAVAYGFVGNLHDAEDVCQGAFIRAYKNLQTLEKAQSFRSWLLQIVTNLSLNFRRDRAVGDRRRVSFEDCLGSEEDSPESRLAVSQHADEQPGAELEARELAEITRKLIAELSEQQRTALVLFSIEQLPQKEVAQIMECSVEAVKWHVFQARRRLRERLAPYL